LQSSALRCDPQLSIEFVQVANVAVERLAETRIHVHEADATLVNAKAALAIAGLSVTFWTAKYQTPPITAVNSGGIS
jgi:hypothetical protein